jgi:hypothetical protein
MIREQAYYKFRIRMILREQAYYKLGLRLRQHGYSSLGRLVVVGGMGDMRREDKKHVKDSRRRKVQVDKIWQVDRASSMMSSCKLAKISKLTAQVDEKLTKISKLDAQVASCQAAS